MKIPTIRSAGRADASLDAKLNPVQLASREIVSWGVAFPRPAGTPDPVAPHPVWRTDATIGSVLGTIGRTPPETTSD